MCALEARILSGLPGVRHGFFTRQEAALAAGSDHSVLDHGVLGHGAASGGGASERGVGLGAFALRLGVRPERLCFVRQMHTPDCVKVDEAWDFQRVVQADAMATCRSDVALMVKTADCAPVLMADSEAGVIAAAHAGWRGALSGVIENTARAMESLGARRKAIVAAIGPCLWQRSYEVGPEFPAPFLAQDPAHAALFTPTLESDRYWFDFPAYVLRVAQACGFASVEPSPADTFADETLFFSYRRGCRRGAVERGRLLSGIALSNRPRAE